jgi:hypothetical protein
LLSGSISCKIYGPCSYLGCMGAAGGTASGLCSGRSWANGKRAAGYV